MEPEQKTFFEKLNSKWLTPLLAVITTIYAFMFKVYNDRYDQNTKNINNLKIQIETELKQKEFENNLKLTIYHEVKDAIIKKDSTLQNATLIVVNEMLKEDTVFKEKLITLLFATPGAGKLITVQKNIDTFSDEQTAIKPSRFTIDVFYLDEIIKEAEPRAKKIVALLQRIFPAYDIRLRLLPKEVNARNGYRIDANQIRFETVESEISKKALEEIVNSKIFELEQPQLLKTSTHSENYISIFVRNM